MMMLASANGNVRGRAALTQMASRSDGTVELDMIRFITKSSGIR
jgi:hypothetical protein